jgi:hypothetical protein
MPDNADDLFALLDRIGNLARLFGRDVRIGLIVQSKDGHFIAEQASLLVDLVCHRLGATDDRLSAVRLCAREGHDDVDNDVAFGGGGAGDRRQKNQGK